MAFSVAASGTQAAVISTEHTLTTQAASNVYQLCVELNNLVAGDRVELRIYSKITSGSTSRIVFRRVYVHAQGTDAAVVYSPPIPSAEFKVTLKQTAGTGRSFGWAVYQYL